MPRDSRSAPVLEAASAHGSCGNNTGATPKVVSPATSYLGLGYGEWAALWWQWAWSIPDGLHHPFSCSATGSDLAQNQAGHVWFLAGAFGECSRDLTLPKGTALFFPVGNGECSTLEGPCAPGPGCFYGTDAPSLSACANLYGDLVQAQSPTCEVDGRALQHLEQYRVQTPLFTFGPLPATPIFVPPADAGLTGQSIDAGTYVLLEPLAAGHHTIHFTAYNPGGVDATYCITVLP